MLITEDIKRNISSLAEKLSTDKEIVEKFGGTLDKNKVAYLIETLLANDTPITTETVVETTKLLFEADTNTQQ